MARKTLAMILAIMMALTALAVVPALADSIETTVSTTRTGDKLYVRKGPHKGNTPTLGTVGNKDKIKLIEINDEYDPEGWSKIEVKSTGTVGYLKNKYIAYFGFDNSSGEVDKDEDTGYDYSKSPDNDGYKGKGSGSSSTGSKVGYVSTRNGGNVNIRKSANGTVIGSVADGTRLSILGTSGKWVKVKTSGGVTGYIHGDYVSEGASARTTAKNGVNLRKGEGTGYDVVKILPYGTSITVISRGNSWSYVNAGGSYGYLSNSYYAYN